jgi:hypothetical protein
MALLGVQLIRKVAARKDSYQNFNAFFLWNYFAGVHEDMRLDEICLS